MSQASSGDVSIVIRGSGGALGSQPNRYAAQVEASVRYADPMAWALVLAIGEATSTLGEDFRAATDRCSLIQVGSWGPLEAMAQAASDALRGFASPLRLPAATPSAPVGLACIVHGIRGPALSLTMPLSDGMRAAFALSAAWLSRSVVDYALIGTAAPEADGPSRASCVVLARGAGVCADPESVVHLLLSAAARR